MTEMGKFPSPLVGEGRERGTAAAKNALSPTLPQNGGGRIAAFVTIFLFFSVCSAVAAPAEPDCVRPMLAPTLDRAVFPALKFTRDARGAGTEKVELDDGTKLTVTHAGCDYYLASYTFELARFGTVAADRKRWYQKAAELLGKIAEANTDENVDLAVAKEYIEAYLAQTPEKSLDYNLEIHIETEEGAPGEAVVVEPPVIKGDISTLTVLYAVGPL